MIALALVVTLGMYGYAFRRARTLGRGVGTGAAAAFTLAIVASGFALLGPLDALADASLTWHMVQHLTLAFAIAPLLLIGAPHRLALATWPARTAGRLARVLGSQQLRPIAHPAIAWLQFTAVLYAVHFSNLYEAALEHRAIHAFEHGLFLVSALWFWTPLLAIAPAPHAPSHPVRILTLFLALPMSAFLGFTLYVTHGVLYRHYAMQPNALADQTNAGAVMWTAGGAPLFLALLWCVADWGRRERRLGAVGDRREVT